MQVTVASVIVISYSAVGTAWTLQEVVVCVVVAVVDIMGVAEVMAMVVIGHGGHSACSWDSCNRGQSCHSYDGHAMPMAKVTTTVVAIVKVARMVGAEVAVHGIVMVGWDNLKFVATMRRCGGRHGKSRRCGDDIEPAQCPSLSWSWTLAAKLRIWERGQGSSAWLLGTFWMQS